MHRISANQNFLLDQIREQGKRIEKLSKLEHDLIKEVHPQVGEIKEGMEEMIAAVKENSENNPPASGRMELPTCPYRGRPAARPRNWAALAASNCWLGSNRARCRRANHVGDRERGTGSLDLANLPLERSVADGGGHCRQLVRPVGAEA